MNKWMMRLYAFAAVHLIWYLLSLKIGAHLIPRPDTVWLYLYTLLFRGTIFLHIFWSLMRMVIAMGLALLIGVPIGLLAGVNKYVDTWFSPVVYLFFPIPKIAFLPLFMALFGFIQDYIVVLCVDFSSYFSGKGWGEANSCGVSSCGADP